MRPPAQGPDAIQGDLVHLNRILRRVQCDPKRSKPLKEKLEAHLKSVITILLNSERVEPTAKK